MKKTFSVRAVFSVITGRIYGENHMDDIYEVLIHVAGQKLQTVDLKAAANKYSSFIYHQLPDELKKEFDSWEHTPNWKEKFSQMSVKTIKLTQFKQN